MTDDIEALQPPDDVEAELRRVAAEAGTAWAMCEVRASLLVQAADAMAALERRCGTEAEAAHEASAQRIAELRECLEWCKRRLPLAYQPYVEGWLRGDANKGRRE